MRLLCKNGNSGEFSLMDSLSYLPHTGSPLDEKRGGGVRTFIRIKIAHSYIIFEYLVRRYMYVEIEATQLFLISQNDFLILRNCFLISENRICDIKI